MPCVAAVKLWSQIAFQEFKLWIHKTKRKDRNTILNNIAAKHTQLTSHSKCIPLFIRPLFLNRATEYIHLIFYATHNCPWNAMHHIIFFLLVLPSTFGFDTFHETKWGVGTLYGVRCTLFLTLCLQLQLRHKFSPDATSLHEQSTLAMLDTVVFPGSKLHLCRKEAFH